MTLVWNAIVSVKIFKEEFNFKPKHRGFPMMLYQWDAFSLSLLILGAMTVALNAPLLQDEDSLTADTLMHMFFEFPFNILGSAILVSFL